MEDYEDDDSPPLPPESSPVEPPKKPLWRQRVPMSAERQKQIEIEDQWLANFPDKFYMKRGSTTFIFHMEFGQPTMKYSNGENESHADMFSKNMDLYGKYGRDSREIRHGSERVPPQFEKFALLGRIGSDKGDDIVSFWNKGGNLYPQLLVPCINKLIQDRKIDKHAIVYTPLHQATTAGDISQGSGSANQQIKSSGSTNRQIQIGSKMYNLMDLPGLLHTLPKLSPERHSIETAIRSSTDPSLSQFKDRLQTPAPSQQSMSRQQWQGATKNPYLYKYGESK